MGRPDPPDGGTSSRRTLPLPSLISAGGGLLLLVAIAQGVRAFTTGEEALVVLLDFVFVAAPAVAFVYTGLWMPRSAIARTRYPRILAWSFGGIAVMYGFILLRDVHPGVSAEWTVGTQAIALTIGSIGGLLIGVEETKATIRTEQLEERTRELEANERELTRHNEQLERFASVISHDLRNPLNVAQGHLALAREERDDERLRTVADAHDRMEALIEDVLELARQGEGISDTEPVGLAGLADRCWETVATAEATLSVETAATVRADSDRLRQLLENLFGNAIEHGGSNVTVTVGAIEGDSGDGDSNGDSDSDGDGFYVADDGPGIPEGVRESVFESGYSTDDDGTGFGLAIVAEIVGAHGWEIRATESAEGGARFEITGVTVDADGE
ncbi:HAMP domain-containing histidine kinase [Halobaculum sp. CBA1158]|uniref:sensor histidine kinase n=1 Tax=Halobaculum sp. CBA1158 TaxID=2904243 RepID=UPI001F31A28E|nr:HAMP domain-containing sensor histidine kinase [Halobaculum sp. CBA1158]UIO99609.1 HAMP domain-containing histidine kinase [Halobaculum sp. CBA1158]